MLQFFRCLMVLTLIKMSHVFGEDGLERQYMTVNEIVREVLQEVNEKAFFSESVRFELLNDFPSMIPILAHWQYNDWHSYDTSLTVNQLVNYFEKQLTENDISFTIVALKDGVPIGSISLDEEGEVEFSDLSGTGPWLGSFHVIFEERNKGIGQELGNAVLTIAKRLGYPQVNFFTSNFSNVAMYLKKGAQIIDTRPFRGHTITIMKLY